MNSRLTRVRGNLLSASWINVVCLRLNEFAREREMKYRHANGSVDPEIGGKGSKTCTLGNDTKRRRRRRITSRRVASFAVASVGVAIEHNASIKRA